MYVKQICDGYSKKSLLGNWFEERQYPDQPFREEQRKQARGKDEGITCFDETGFQRMLPRIERRTKWETAGRIVLHDGYVPFNILRTCPTQPPKQHSTTKNSPQHQHSPSSPSPRIFRRCSVQNCTQTRKSGPTSKNTACSIAPTSKKSRRNEPLT